MNDREIDVCRSFRPYAQPIRTLTLGCVNCGRSAAAHPEACQKCCGAGVEGDDKGIVIEGSKCESCGGTGRSSGKVEYL